MEHVKTGKGGWAAIIFDFKNQKTVLCGFDHSKLITGWR